MPGPIKKKSSKKKQVVKKQVVKKINIKFLANSCAVTDCALRDFVQVFGSEMEVTAKNISMFYHYESTWNRWGPVVLAMQLLMNC